MSRNKKYVVEGTHRVHGVKPGDTVALDPNKPETARLLARGHIADAPSGQQSAGGASTKDGPDTGSSKSEE